MSRICSLAEFFRAQFSGDRQRAATWLLTAARRCTQLGYYRRALLYADTAAFLLEVQAYS